MLLVLRTYLFFPGLRAGDYSTFGRDLGALALSVNLDACETPACKIAEAIIQTLSDMTVDVSKCKAYFPTLVNEFELFATEIHRGRFNNAMGSLSRGLEGVMKAVKTCKAIEVVKDAGFVAELLNFYKLKVSEEVKLPGKNLPYMQTGYTYT